MAKVAIVGSRDYPRVEFVAHYVGTLHTSTTIISGGAAGPDTLACEAAARRGLPEPIVYRPDYKRYPVRFAPLHRNTDIAHACDHMVAFWNWSFGTADVVDKAVRLGKHVQVFGPTGEAIAAGEVVTWLRDQRAARKVNR